VTHAVTAFAVLALSALSANAAAAEPEFKVGFLAGGDRDNNFWVRMGQFAEAVAEDLNIDLQIRYPSPATYVIKRRGEQLIKSLDEGDFFTTIYFDAVTADLLQAAELREVRSFIINTEILEQDRQRVGTPREKFRHWIGHMRPDDRQAGYVVADEIFKHFDNPKSVKMIAVNGDPSVQVAVDRLNGLKERMDESPRATLHTVATADWLHESARVTTQELLDEYPDTNAIWAASDPMALGAIEAIEQAGLEPGKDVVTASIDWTNEGLKAVQSGKMLASVGGHFMEAGIALLLMYDYHHGEDFAGELGASFKTPMYPVTRDDIDDYFEKVGTNPDWSSIDFKQFTKTHNPDLDRYDFSWPAISGQL
jgi:ABC-type sugar transport system substrate-binding protein